MNDHTALSPEAQRARDDAAIRYREQKQLVEKMRGGPYCQDGLLRIPAYFYNSTISPLANAEWKRRGLRWDSNRREWWAAIPTQCAADQVRKARALFDFFWNVDRTPEVTPC